MRPGRSFRLTTITLAVGVKVVDEKTSLQIIAHNSNEDDKGVPTPTTLAHLKVGFVCLFVQHYRVIPLIFA